VSVPLETIQADFNRIALHWADGWNPNSYYYDFILRQLPSHLSFALEIGCGTGDFSRLLAGRADRVLAVDLSPNMIDRAREDSRKYSNIDFQVADAVAQDFPSEHFDAVVSIATLHHLPLSQMLQKMKSALRVGGTLAVLDLFQVEGLSGVFSNAVAMPLSVSLRLLKNRRLRVKPDLRKAWAEHDLHDTFPRLGEVRNACSPLLPGAQIKRHLLWRYSIIWTKTDNAD
jgi:ubiquinone/menaquinone biosynthesis C-methylase UbiE